MDRQALFAVGNTTKKGVSAFAIAFRFSWALMFIAMLGMAINVAALPRVVRAQENQPIEQADEQNDQAEEENLEEESSNVFEYIAERGNNLTLLVRRSLQLYDESAENVKLSRAATIYAETNIVQDMGPRELAVGEQVEVPYASVEQYANSSEDLSPAQIAAWDRYATQARFELSSIQPTDNVARNAENNEGRNSQQDEGTGNNGTDDETNDDRQRASEEESGSNWQRLAIGAAALLAAYYFYRRSQNEAPPEATGNRKSTK